MIRTVINEHASDPRTAAPLFHAGRLGGSGGDRWGRFQTIDTPARFSMLLIIEKLDANDRKNRRDDERSDGEHDPPGAHESEHHLQTNEIF